MTENPDEGDRITKWLEGNLLGKWLYGEKNTPEGEAIVNIFGAGIDAASWILKKSTGSLSIISALLTLSSKELKEIIADKRSDIEEFLQVQHYKPDTFKAESFPAHEYIQKAAIPIISASLGLNELPPNTVSENSLLMILPFLQNPSGFPNNSIEYQTFLKITHEVAKHRALALYERLNQANPATYPLPAIPTQFSNNDILATVDFLTKKQFNPGLPFAGNPFYNNFVEDPVPGTLATDTDKIPATMLVPDIANGKVFESSMAFASTTLEKDQKAQDLLEPEKAEHMHLKSVELLPMIAPLAPTVPLLLEAVDTIVRNPTVYNRFAMPGATPAEQVANDIMNEFSGNIDSFMFWYNLPAGMLDMKVKNLQLSILNDDSLAWRLDDTTKQYIQDGVNQITTGSILPAGLMSIDTNNATAMAALNNSQQAATRIISHLTGLTTVASQDTSLAQEWLKSQIGFKEIRQQKLIDRAAADYTPAANPLGAISPDNVPSIIEKGEPTDQLVLIQAYAIHKRIVQPPPAGRGWVMLNPPPSQLASFEYILGALKYHHASGDEKTTMSTSEEKRAFEELTTFSPGQFGLAQSTFVEDIHRLTEQLVTTTDTYGVQKDTIESIRSTKQLVTNLCDIYSTLRIRAFASTSALTAAAEDIKKSVDAYTQMLTPGAPEQQIITQLRLIASKDLQEMGLTGFATWIKNEHIEAYIKAHPDEASAGNFPLNLETLKSEIFLPIGTSEANLKRHFKRLTTLFRKLSEDDNFGRDNLNLLIQGPKDAEGWDSTKLDILISHAIEPDNVARNIRKLNDTLAFISTLEQNPDLKHLYDEHYFEFVKQIEGGDISDAYSKEHPYRALAIPPRFRHSTEQAIGYASNLQQTAENAFNNAENGMPPYGIFGDPRVLQTVAHITQARSQKELAKDIRAINAEDEHHQSDARQNHRIVRLFHMLANSNPPRFGRWQDFYTWLSTPNAHTDKEILTLLGTYTGDLTFDNEVLQSIRWQASRLHSTPLFRSIVRTTNFSLDQMYGVFVLLAGKPIDDTKDLGHSKRYSREGIPSNFLEYTHRAKKVIDTYLDDNQLVVAINALVTKMKNSGVTQDQITHAVTLTETGNETSNSDFNRALATALPGGFPSNRMPDLINFFNSIRYVWDELPAPLALANNDTSKVIVHQVFMKCLAKHNLVKTQKYIDDTITPSIEEIANADIMNSMNTDINTERQRNIIAQRNIRRHYRRSH